MDEKAPISVGWQGAKRSFSSADSPITIGRDASSDVRISGEGVSRHHAELTWSDGEGWMFRDLDTTQGSRVDGERIVTHQVSRNLEIVLAQGGQAVSINLEVGPASGPVGEPTTGAEVDRTIGPDAAATGVISGPARPGGRLSQRDLGATVVTGDALAVECAGATRTLEPGREYVVGRDPQSDIVSSNPNVSRRHAVITHSRGQWTFADSDSSGGSYLDGRRIDRSAITGSMVFVLGDADAGERLVVKASGERELSWSQRIGQVGRGGQLGLVAAALAVVALVVVVASSGGDGESGPDFDQLTRGVVQISSTDAATGGAGGSGTIIDKERGLILTNAHVAGWGEGEGLALNYGYNEEWFQDIEDILISVSPGLDRPAEPRFKAELVAVDGYLDLAILQITETLTGQFVEPVDLEDLTEIELGSSSEVETGDPAFVLGFPGVSQNSAVTLTQGPISGFLPDERTGSNRGWIQMDAEVRGGNSGGLLADSEGAMVGVPSKNVGADQVRAGEAVVSTSRAIDLAQQMIEDVQAGETYESPFITPLTGNEKIAQLGYGPLVEGESGYVFECGSPVAEAGIDNDETLAVQLNYEGFVEGEHQDLLVTVGREPAASSVIDTYRASDVPVPEDAATGALIGAEQTEWQTPIKRADGCLTATVVLDEPLLPLFDYTVAVHVGGNLKILQSDTWTPAEP